MRWWRSLNEDDKYEELAYDRYRQNSIKRMIEPFWDRLNNDKPISSVEAFYALWQQTI